MKINDNCPCKKIKCERHGDCDACRKHHMTVKKKVMTACDRIKYKDEIKIKSKE